MNQIKFTAKIETVFHVITYLFTNQINIATDYKMTIAGLNESIRSTIYTR